MNDKRYDGDHRSTAVGNGLLALLTIAGAIMAVVIVPLEIFGGS